MTHSRTSSGRRIPLLTIAQPILLPRERVSTWVEGRLSRTCSPPPTDRLRRSRYEAFGYVAAANAYTGKNLNVSDEQP